MIKTRLASSVPAVWNQPFNLTLTLASQHDANFNYVTFSIRPHLAAMFGNTMTWKRFCDTYKQGDYFLLQLNGQVVVPAKINRATMDTMAFHCPRIVQMPTWGPDGPRNVTVQAVLMGFTGLNMEPKAARQRLDPTTAQDLFDQVRQGVDNTPRRMVISGTFTTTEI